MPTFGSLNQLNEASRLILGNAYRKSFALTGSTWMEVCSFINECPTTAHKEYLNLVHLQELPTPKEIFFIKEIIREFRSVDVTPKADITSCEKRILIESQRQSVLLIFRRRVNMLSRNTAFLENLNTISENVRLRTVE